MPEKKTITFRSPPCKEDGSIFGKFEGVPIEVDIRETSHAEVAENYRRMMDSGTLDDRDMAFARKYLGF